MRLATERRQRLHAWPVGVVLVAICSFQFGGTLAKQMFPLVGPLGAATLRLSLAAMILSVVTRPWRVAREAVAIGPLIVYGLAIAGLNGFFYLAVRTIPYGIAVAIDFIGPLGVAVLFSRRRLDLAWVAMAACGLLMLLPFQDADAALDPAGVAFCLAGALSWALYIVFGQKLGATLPSGQATALGITIAACTMLPLGIVQAGPALLSPAVLPVALVVAILSSALPNSLEMVAMKRLPTRLFGVLMSLEPAVAALFGFLVLRESLTVRQCAAVALVILASAGATLTAARGSAVPEP